MALKHLEGGTAAVLEPYCDCPHSKGLPNFICLQVTRRYGDNSGLENYHLIDTIAERLSYFEEKEDYKLVSINGVPDTRSVRHEQLGGATSSGEFGSILKEIFDAETHTEFSWERWATLRGKRAGSLGDAACFSFYPSKVMGALGDGGAITTSSDQLRDAIKQLRYMGQKGTKHEHLIIGYQERLDELQAAFLSVKLRHLDAQVAGRRRVAAAYAQGLGGTPLTLPAHDVTGTHAYYMYTVQAPRRAELVAHLEAQGVKTQLIYPHLVPDQQAYANSPWRASDDLAVARSLTSTLLCLPMFAELTDDEVDRVAAAIRAFYGAD